MAAKKKSKILVRLLNKVTGTCYIRWKNLKSLNPKAKQKLSFRKYDPKLRKHVLLEEHKMPPHSK